jgi:glycosyltransferase involved in cell wall biosynthesis
MSLSVIIITRNESANIVACLQSVSFADEVIVLDGQSTDDTISLAQKYGATVVHSQTWEGFGHQKNKALAHATHDLFVCQASVLNQQYSSHTNWHILPRL